MGKLAAASLLVASSAFAAPGAPVPEVAGLLPGTYLSRDAGASVRFAVAAVPNGRRGGGAPVFYAEAARTSTPYAPFFQRFLRLEEDGAARVAVRVYEPRDLAGVRGKWREPDALALFSSRDMRERPDCRLTLERSPGGAWAGGTAGATCFSAAANARLAVTLSLSPQALEWREGGKDSSGRPVYGSSGEISVFWREREGAGTPAPVAGAPAPLAAPAGGDAGRGGGFSAKVNEAAARVGEAAPADGGAKREGAFSSKVNEPAASAPPGLVVTSLSSPSKRYSISELRGLAGSDRVPVEELLTGTPTSGRGAAIVIVTSSSGALSVFSFAEISSPGGPVLDLSGASPRLVATGGRGLADVVSIELRVLAPASAP
jgi:hypothetical protein